MNGPIGVSVGTDWQCESFRLCSRKFFHAEGNPFAWAYRALIVNEFRSGVWEDPDTILVQNGFVTPDGSPFGQEWVGYGCLYMVIYYLLCCVFTALGLGTIRNTGEVLPPEKKPATNAEGDGADTTSQKVEIPFTPLTLSFHDLCYEVTASTSKAKIMLLKNVNGIFRPGRLCALMGSSGAVSAARFNFAKGLDLCCWFSLFWCGRFDVPIRGRPL
jgi:hypothetical protein